MPTRKNLINGAVILAVLFSLFSIALSNPAGAAPPSLMGGQSPTDVGSDQEQQSSGSSREPTILSDTPPEYSYYLPAIMAPCPNFSDNFSNPDSGWWTGVYGYEEWQYFYGEYRVFITSSDYIAAEAAPTCQRQNYTVQVDVRKVYGYSDHGIVFGLNADWSKFYLFAVDPYYQDYILLYFNTNANPQWTVIKNYTKSSAIKTGSSYNRLKVIRNGTKITLYVNEAKLGDWTHSGTQGETSVGLFSATYVDYWQVDSRFDNFSVTMLPSTGITASEAEEAVSVRAAAAEGTDRPYQLLEVYPRDR